MKSHLQWTINCLITWETTCTYAIIFIFMFMRIFYSHNTICTICTPRQPRQQAYFTYVYIHTEIQETVIKCRSKEKSLHIVHRYLLEIVWFMMELFLNTFIRYIVWFFFVMPHKRGFDMFWNLNKYFHFLNLIQIWCETSAAIIRLLQFG